MCRLIPLSPHRWTHKDAAYCPYAFSYCADHTTLEGVNPATAGVNFVDTSLKVVVKTSGRSLLVFRPNELHVTTQDNGVVNRSITFAFSKRIGDAFAQLKELQMKGKDVEIYDESTSEHI